MRQLEPGARPRRACAVPTVSRIAVAVAALVTSACGAGAHDRPASELSPVDVGLLDGRTVFVGRALTGDTLPLMAITPDGGSATVVLFDPTNGLEALPALPVDGAVGDTALAAGDDVVVVSVLVCSATPVPEDAGFSCPPGSGAATELFAFDRRAEVWHHRLVPGPGAPGIRAIVGDRALVGDTTVFLTSGLPDAPPVEALDGPRCRSAMAPVMTFDRDDRPVTAEVGGVVRPVPEAIRARMKRIVPGVVACHSAGRFLATDTAAENVLWGSADPDGPASATRPGAPTTPAPTRPAVPDTMVTVVDLDDPGQVVKVGDSATYRAFGAGTGYWAFQDRAGLQLHDVDAGTHRVVPLADDQEVVHLPSALLVLTMDEARHVVAAATLRP